MPHKFATSRRCRQAFTLLEVILALAILGGAVAVLGEIMRAAGRRASDAQAETRAQLLACSLMDEMVTGVLEPAEQTRVALEVDDTVPWVYSVTFGAIEIEGLVSIELIVEQDLQQQFNPVRYRLVRWVPSITEAAEADDEASEQSEEGSEAQAEQDDSSGGGDAS